MTKLTLESVSVGNLENIDLQIAPGEIVCLSGPSGAGKSRLLRAVADLEPHGGSVSLDSTEQASVPAHRWRRQVMMVPAESAWWFDSVGEHLSKPAPEMLHALGLADRAGEWPVSRLSSGEKQRLALLRALICEPRVLLLDEPTANLDERTTRQVEHWLQSVVRERRCPVLWVAHSEEQIRRVAKRHFRIEGPRLLEVPV
ncbi:ABC transporter ATP-binding protein [Microbulbifer pacificus]|uniref:ABC transporter ATP-binding protein n=1 Tax=Microbulbifer pacificus TaxID=407164 RepID=UPI000CF406BF|nr:ATP-binding cassette domain-containing protein [Microbulbifer pacificus]